MSITTYAELQTAAGNWLNRTDLSARITEFISLAEAEFDRNIRHHKMRARATASMDSQYTDLPDDWMSPITIRLLTTPIRELQIVSPNAMLDIRASGNESGAKPRFVTTVADTLDVYPTPGDTYTVEMHYWARIPKLSASNTSNWLLSSYPDVYLWGTLVAAEPYVMNDERLPIWRSQLEKAYEDMRREFDRSYGPTTRRIRTFG